MARTKGRHEAERTASPAVAALRRTLPPATRAGVLAFALPLALLVPSAALDSGEGSKAQVGATVVEDEYANQKAVTITSADDTAPVNLPLVTAAPAPAEPRQEATVETGANHSSNNSDDAVPTREVEVPAPAVSPDTATAPTKASSSGERILQIAEKYIGVPYVWGGTSTSGWDCSGFTRHVFSEAGVNLPRTSGAQKAAGTVVSASEARAGDLVWHPGHIGIYAGNGMMYDAGTSAGTSYRSHAWMGNVTYIRVL